MAGKKTWMRVPQKSPKPGVPEEVKQKVSIAADKLVADVLRPIHVKPAPKDSDYNYLVDIFTKWYRSYFYFCSKYACPGPDAMAPFFDDKFARMEYVGDDRFNLSYMRHTEQWFEVEHNLSLNECLNRIKMGGNFCP